MNILISSYYGANVRFFDYIVKSLKTEIEKVDVFFLNLYPSANIYTKKYGYSGVLLRKIPKLKEINLERIEKIEYFIETELKLHKGKHKEELLKIAQSYYEYILDVIKKRKIDFIISSSDEYMIGRILKTISKEKNIKILYFEQGPFGTTILDFKGVNNNVSFKNKFCSKIDLGFFNKIENRERFYLKDKGYKYYKLLDYLYLGNYKIGKEFFRNENIFTIINQRFIKKIFFFDKKYKKIEKKFILLILQVPYDVQMLCNSPIYKNFYEIVKDIYKNKPKDIEVIVREHPLYMGKKKNRDIYEYIEGKNDIRINNDLSLNVVLEKAELVIVNNSTVGLEALRKYKKLIVLGDSYYDSSEICFKISNRKEIKSIIETALKNERSKNKIDEFFTNLGKNLIYTHFLNDKYSESDRILKVILERYRNEEK